MNLITLFLTCTNKAEADKISAKLLDDKLAACVRQAAVSSDFLWQGKREHSDEVMLIIESAEDKFEAIESAAKSLHSYDTFVLTAYPVAKASAGVREWIEQELNKGNTNMQIDTAKLFTDGGSRGNPGPSAIAYVICKMDNSVVEKSGEYIGDTTNNQAEYQALKMGLKRAGELGVKKLTVNLDSELVVKQINGLYKMKNAELRPHYDEVKRLAGQFQNIVFQHVPRKLNAEADAEVNRILDSQTK
jgi:ribonuclease HI